MGDTPAAVFFARTFRQPVQQWLDQLWSQTWHGQAPARPQTYEECVDQALVPAVPPANPDMILWPTEAMCTAWTPIFQRPVELSCRVYADDTSKTHIVSSAKNAKYTLEHAHVHLRDTLSQDGDVHNSGKST
eukprot:5827681-Pyramimonas_sp.AAC.1